MRIIIVGAGSFGTSLGNVLVKNSTVNLELLARKKEIVNSINKLNMNEQYFPNFRLDDRLTASVDITILRHADVVFLAIPSTNVIEFVNSNKEYFSKNAIVVVLSKGFGRNSKTIVESINDVICNQVCSLKGPTFAADLIHNNPSAFTLATRNKELFDIFKSIFKNTNIYLDLSLDILGVEILSALKNVYAILLGIIDAYFNSANVRFLILTKAFNEMKEIVLKFGGLEETMYKYCGFGDFGLTALNDLSRNRTLGLLIGKGFLNGNTTNSVILEGMRTIDIIYKSVSAKGNIGKKYYMLNAIYRLFNSDYGVSRFITSLFDHIRTSPF